MVNFDWLSPFTISEVLRGKKILENLRAASGDKVSTYNYHEYVIKAPLLHKGIKYYDMALRIYMGAVLKRHKPVPPVTTDGEGNWIDLMGPSAPRTRSSTTSSRVALTALRPSTPVLRKSITITTSCAGRGATASSWITTALTN